MATVILTIHLLLALALIIVVLLQRSEGGGLGIGGGGGGGMMTGRAAATALSKLTWMIGSAFVVTSLVLTVFAAQDSGADSVIDGILPGSAAPLDPATPPALGEDLLPPLPADASGAAAPPAVEGPAAPPASD